MWPNSTSTTLPRSAARSTGFAFSQVAMLERRRRLAIELPLGVGSRGSRAARSRAAASRTSPGASPRPPATRGRCGKRCLPAVGHVDSVRDLDPESGRRRDLARPILHDLDPPANVGIARPRRRGPRSTRPRSVRVPRCRGRPHGRLAGDVGGIGLAVIGPFPLDRQVSLPRGDDGLASPLAIRAPALDDVASHPVDHPLRDRDRGAGLRSVSSSIRTSSSFLSQIE